jgi:hypothetical protein
LAFAETFKLLAGGVLLRSLQPRGSSTAESTINGPANRDLSKLQSSRLSTCITKHPMGWNPGGILHPAQTGASPPVADQIFFMDLIIHVSTQGFA